MRSLTALANLPADRPAKSAALPIAALPPRSKWLKEAVPGGAPFGRLRFADRRLEAAYRQDRVAYRTLHSRYSALVVLLIWASSTLIDRWLVPEQTPETLELRFCGMIGAIGLFLLTVVAPRGRWIEGASLVFGIVNIGLVFWLKLAIAPASDDLIRASSLFMILTAASFVVGALQFREGILCALLSLAGFAAVTLVLKPEPLPQMVYGAFFIASTAGVSGFAAYMLECSERLAWLRRGELAAAQEQIRALLDNVLPPAIAERKRAGERLIADDYAAVTVLFADIVDFTGLSERVGSHDVVAHLNAVFSRFDVIVARHGLEKIKTVGDSYMAVAGVPETRPDHLRAAVAVALEMLAETRRWRRPDGEALAIRIGMHTGPVTAGVIGRTKFLFDVWGDTVNLASRLQAQGRPDAIHVSEAVYRGLRCDFIFDDPRLVDVKGKGACRTWQLVGVSRSDELTPVRAASAVPE